ncbi:[protein-PII] uridylyltransferase [bacterium]|nr:[protein-PII] uridylyltransferase [bacterium]
MLTSKMTELSFGDKFQKIYKDIKDLHASNKNNGIQVVNKFSNQIDKLISSELSLSYKNKGVAVLALGGYGRRELCIKSDIDILILYEKPKIDEAKKIAENILYKLWDTGLEGGNSLRTIDECLELSSTQDSTILTSLLDLRAIAGDSLLNIKLQNDLNKKLLPNISQNFINKKILERNKRFKKYGTASYLNEPNLKEGQGCLRDIHTIFWVLKSFNCQIEINKFLDGGFLSKNELKVINYALNFLLTTRNHLHLIKNHEIDIADFNSQVDIADFYNLEDESFLTKENIFMKKLYQITNEIRELTDKIIEETLHKKVFSSRRIQNLDDFFIIHRGLLRVINPNNLLSDLNNIIKAFELSASNKVKISEEILIEIKKVTSQKLTVSDKKLLNKAFLEVLKKGKNVFKILTDLNKINLLSFFIPEFERIKNLPLADPSHIYTVDHHSILLIKEFEKLLNGEYKKDFPLETSIALKLKKKETFYLTSILHDIGKGYGNNHAERGAKMVEKICNNLGCENETKINVEFLVREHLLMSNYSQKRDLDDNELIKEFKDRIQTSEKLSNLFILTFCDLRSVAPDVWSTWKGNLLSLLYKKANKLFSTKEINNKTKVVSLNKIKKDNVLSEIDRNKFDKIFGKATSAYFNTYSEDELIYQIRMLIDQKNHISIGVKYSQKNNVDQVTIWSKNREVGFSEICGALSSSSINIYSGRATSIKKNLSLYTFEVNRFGKSTFRDRLIWNQIQNQLETNIGIDSFEISHNIKTKKRNVKSKINIDNESSKKFTIIELTSPDQPGILYKISKILNEEKLEIGFVKISTRRSSVEDSFYIKKAGGKKLISLNEIESVKIKLENILK